MFSFRRRFSFARLLRSKAPQTPQESDRQFQIRLLVAFGAILFAFGILFTRFVWLQVFQFDHFSTLAQQNRISFVPIVPNRGLIVDRNGVVLVQNYSAYTLELTPSKIPDLPATLEELGRLVEITPRDLKRFRKLKAESRNFESIPLKLKLTDDEVARVAAESYRLPGVEINARLFRDYPYKDQLAHVVGYIGRINQRDKDRLDEEEKSANYRGSTHIGKTGLEAVYEDELHGQTGFEEVETDAGGRAIRTLRRTPPVNGKTLRLALDIRLQQKAFELFGDRRGALVAIEPATGGVLAFVSKPGFDPNLFVDGIDSQSWKDLNEDWKRPLINRALRGLYPPGSTFKPFMAMAALESGFRDPGYTIADPGYFTLPGSSHRFRDSKPAGHGTVNLFKSIQVSSDTYYYKLAWDMGIDRIAPELAKFGLGSVTGIDLDHEAKGVLPSKEWKTRRFAAKRYREEHRRWLPADVVPIGIGQGYNAYTPLQMAQATAILANNGVVFKPHVVKEIVDTQTGTSTLVEPQPVRDNHFKPQHVDFVKSAMAAVLKPGGTAARLGGNLAYEMAGKTGTAQVVQIKQGAKYNAAALAEQHRDHSWFIAFAPVAEPKIAIAVIVENGGWGAAAAAPIARQLTDFYLLGDQLPAGWRRRPRNKVPKMHPNLISRVWARIKAPVDGWLLLFVVLLFAVSLVVLYSASNESMDRIANKAVFMLVALGLMWLVANIRPEILMQLALPGYLAGLVLLLGVAVAGEVVNGSRRWLDIGITRIQPSEIMKILVPMTVAWFFQRFEGKFGWWHYVVAALILGVPMAFVLKQPDLGTATLIGAAGFFVIFFAGLPWRVLLIGLSGFAATLPVIWTLLHDYQRRRVLTLLDPTQDPLGAGYHIIQSMIAIGSGGPFGKGWLSGTQTHLDFIPERTTDFIFAVYAEEFGLLGNGLLLVLYTLVIARGLMIAAKATTLFGRLLAGAITLSFFTYAFVNMGMVSGILPVVGVPLPLVSYGGTAMVTILTGFGILMSIHKNRPLLKR